MSQVTFVITFSLAVDRGILYISANANGRVFSSLKCNVTLLYLNSVPKTYGGNVRRMRNFHNKNREVSHLSDTRNFP